ncbi:MAG: transglutaminase domain-containing protein [Nitrospiraceae bacterium]
MALAVTILNACDAYEQQNTKDSYPDTKQSSADNMSQAKIAAQAFRSARDFISRDATYISDDLTWDAGIDRTSLKEFTTALATMNYVQSRVSSTQYGYLSYRKERPLPTSDELCLLYEAGICGNQISVFLSLLSSLGLTARSLEFYWHNDHGIPMSHIAAEVNVGGKWVFFDVTWGAYYKRYPHSRGHKYFIDALSFAEVRLLEDAAKHRVTNSSNLAFRLQEENGIDPFSYIHSAHSALVGKTGVIYPALINNNEGDNGGQRVRLQGIPDYIGTASDYSTGLKGHLRYVIHDPGIISEIIFTTSGTNCNEQTADLVIKRGSYNFRKNVTKTGATQFLFRLEPRMRSVGDLEMALLSSDNEPVDCTLSIKEILLH